ncbi:MAG TPA: zinc ribbon domain-containing protein [Dictyobacter sp.]|jgi:hypothetical protein|nr:zinc ribbon domain-containing protein [Dictyobacter sp.]
MSKTNKNYTIGIFIFTALSIITLFLPHPHTFSDIGVFIASLLSLLQTWQHNQWKWFVALLICNPVMIFLQCIFVLLFHFYFFLNPAIYLGQFLLVTYAAYYLYKQRSQKTICPSCHAAIQKDSYLCTHCGYTLQAPSDPDVKPTTTSTPSGRLTLLCPICQAPYDDTDVFCGSCGYELTIASEQEV